MLILHAAVSIKRNDGLTAAIKKLGRPMTYYPSLAKMVGLKESIFLCQLVYWTPRGHAENGWIYKSVTEMEDETGLTYKEQIRIREALSERGLIEQDYRREEHNLYFRVCEENLDALAQEHITNGHMPESKVASDQRETGTLPKVSNHLPKSQIDKGSRDYTEITTEITQGETAPDFHPTQWAGKLIEDIQQFPYELQKSHAMIRSIALSIEALIAGGKSVEAAYEFLKAVTFDGIERGERIDKFWFEDSKWRNVNGNQRQVSAAGSRSQRSATSLINTVRKRVDERNARDQAQCKN